MTTMTELTKIARQAWKAREILSGISKTHHVDISLKNADDDYIWSVDIVLTPEFSETLKAHIRDHQSMVLAEATATLAKHGIELEPMEEEVEEEAEAA